MFDLDMWYAGAFSNQDMIAPMLPTIDSVFDDGSNHNFDTALQYHDNARSLPDSIGSSSTSVQIVDKPSLVHQSSSGSSGWTSVSGLCTPVEDEDEDEDDAIIEEQDSDGLLVVTHGKRKRGSLKAKDREDAAKARQMKACIRCRAQKLKKKMGWSENGRNGKQKKAVGIPPYAILDMEEAAQDFRKIIDDTAFEHINEYL
ncbi:hypothetical protein N0V90_001156 [Kalmusia sp. IMI 367209]|nr:hypothetical protein N0V90_001156 [Kalmusia sp. IMI 367209]